MYTFIVCGINTVESTKTAAKCALEAKLICCIFLYTPIMSKNIIPR